LSAVIGSGLVIPQKGTLRSRSFFDRMNTYFLIEWFPTHSPEQRRMDGAPGRFFFNRPETWMLLCAAYHRALRVAAVTKGL
jgi:hypothetical protein